MDSWDSRAKKDLKGLARNKLREHYIIKGREERFFNKTGLIQREDRRHINKTGRFFLTCFSGKVL